jgi:DNA/RNA-binding domain of Phe-tRNA-synthetase-like protein
MENINFVISEQITKFYPHLRVGIITGKGLSNSEINQELEQMTREAENQIRENFTTFSIGEHPYIKAWREIYKSFGVKPKDHRPTCEALIRRVLKGEKVPTINTIVNSYLLGELLFLLPCGGYDIDKVEGTIFLRYSVGNEEFVPIGGREIEFTTRGEIVYADDSKILTRRWNYRDSDLTKITLDTQNVILLIEAPSKDITTESLQEFLKTLSSLLTRFCSSSDTIINYNIVDVDDYL